MDEDNAKIQRRATALFQQSPYPTALCIPYLLLEGSNAVLAGS